MKLYSYFRSSASWRVRIGLAYKGLPFDYAAVHLLKGEQQAPAHRARNPMGQVPVLELDDGRRLSQSLAILEFLDELHPEPPLLPRDPFERARVRQLAELVNAGTQPLQNLPLLHYVKDTLHGDEVAFARHFVGRGLRALEAEAKASAGRYVFGDTVTLADLFLVPQLAGARRFGVELAELPTLVRVEAACNELAAFVAAAPERQPDAERPQP